MDPAEIDLPTLKMVIDRILDALIERTKTGAFPIGGADKYWEILGDDLFDLSKEPRELAVGSLADDMELLAVSGRTMIEGYPPAIYSLVHAAPILRFLAEQHSKSNNP